MKTQTSVLLIDDDDIFIFLTKKLLQNNGKASVINVCHSAEEAINYIKSLEDENIPDIILLDLNMPQVSGWQFLEIYKTILPQLNTKPELYIVSSSIAQNDKERAMQIKGVTGYIAKPLTPESIETILR